MTKSTKTIASRPAAAVLSFAVLLGAAVAGAPARATDDILTRALADEMARTMARLRLEPFAGPYRVAYTAIESEQFSADANFGSLVRKGRGKSRTLRADVRVGDYTLDNSNFEAGGGGFFGGGGGGGAVESLPEEDDYEAIRHRAWLVTDGAYKGALETLARKKAFLETNTVTDRPADLSPELPPVLAPPYAEKARLAIDEERWAKAAVELSSVFRSFPEVQDSSVSFGAVARTRTFLTSEGIRNRTAETTLRLDVSAGTQAVDGMPLGDALSFVGRLESDMPPLEEMKAKVEALAKGLAARVSARRAEEYIGPVLFEGEAAGEFLLQLLVDRLANPREPLGSRGGGGTPFKNRLRKRVLPAFLTVIDDPSLASFAGKPLLGAYAIDDDGFPAQKVTLVEDGRLLSWYMSRVPTREIAKTNGHGRNGVGDAGSVIVTSKLSVPEAKLREELLRNAREQELAWAVRVESLSRTDLRVRGARGPGARGGSSEASLSAPVRAYWVSVEDGREEPMRGGEFQAVTLRTLRDVILTGDTPHVLNTTRRSHAVSIVTPSLLVEEMEMRKPTEEQVKAPQLKHPHFDKP